MEWNAWVVFRWHGFCFVSTFYASTFCMYFGSICMALLPHFCYGLFVHRVYILRGHGFRSRRFFFRSGIVFAFIPPWRLMLWRCTAYRVPLILAWYLLIIFGPYLVFRLLL